MSKPATPHFDAEGLVEEVLRQDVGLRVSSNNPQFFRQIVYKAARQMGKKIHIYQCPRSANAFLLLKKEMEVESE